MPFEPGDERTYTENSDLMRYVSCLRPTHVGFLVDDGADRGSKPDLDVAAISYSTQTVLLALLNVVANGS